jgi:hypothetical protein
MLDYILVMLGGAFGTGARFWASGFVAEKGRGDFPSGNARRERYGILRYWILCRIYRSGRAASCVTAASSILHDRRVRRLHNVFIIQLTNARSRSGWRLVQGLLEHGALIRLLCRSGMAWTHSCSRTIAEIKTSHAPSRRRCPPADFYR